MENSEKEKKEKILDQAAEKLAELFLWQIYQDLNFPKDKDNKNKKNEQHER